MNRIPLIIATAFLTTSLLQAEETKPATAPNAEKQKADQESKVYLTQSMATKTDSYNHLNQDMSWDGNKISIGGKNYEHGFGAHAPSELVFPLNEKYSSFHVVPGPDDEHTGQIEMKILVDGKEVYSTGKTGRDDGNLRTPQDIPVKGAKSLSLVVTPAEEGVLGGCHASWGDAFLTK